MRRFLTVALALSLLLFGGLLIGSPAVADGIQVTDQGAQNQFPNGIRVTLSASSTADITAVRLHFRILPDGPRSTANGLCTTGRVISCTYDVGAGSKLVPGEDVRFSWEISDANGNQITSEEQDVVYQDNRFQWQSIKNDQATLYYYSGSASSNQQLLDAASSTLDKFSKIEGTSFEFPIKVWVYASPQDLQAAVSNFGQGVIGGEVEISDTALVARGFEDVKATLQHEVTHLVTARAMRSDQPVGDDYVRYDMPLWLNEGISVYAQGSPGAAYGGALDDAVRTDHLLPITSLTPSLRDSGNTVNLWYGEAGSLVGYLIDTYGDEKFAAFIKALRNNLIEDALQQAYGFGLNDWQNQWRQSLGLKPIEDTTSSRQSGAQEIPTLVPLGAPQSISAAPVATATPRVNNSAATSTDSGGGSSALPIAAGVALIVIVLAGGGFVLLRRRSRSPAA